MPELPEVHALAADLRARLSGKTIQRLDVLAVSALKTFDPPSTAVAGTTVRDVVRHGKFLDLVLGAAPADSDDAPGDVVSGRSTSGDSAAGDAAGEDGATDETLHLVAHLARAGWIRWRADPPKTSARPSRGPLAARIVLEDGSGLDITEAGTKKSLALYLAKDPQQVPGIARLGPDPLGDGFREADFAAILAQAGKARIKGVLRDQTRLAGIGNAYSDEILHVARMSPYKPADMAADDVSRLYAALRQTLADAVERSEGLAASELKKEKKENLRVHGRAGEPCPVCGDTVRQVIFADTTFQYCPTCQTGGKPLADRVLSRLLK